ncbi:hypothetical protein OH77DRAFT_822218 [Trametes cingulata]|nr:hypothetical protein OH77DRAFT_822218 [Trametes cingulata]
MYAYVRPWRRLSYVYGTAFLLQMDLFVVHDLAALLHGAKRRLWLPNRHSALGIGPREATSMPSEAREMCRHISLGMETAIRAVSNLGDLKTFRWQRALPRHWAALWSLGQPLECPIPCNLIPDFQEYRFWRYLPIVSTDCS